LIRHVEPGDGLSTDRQRVHTSASATDVRHAEDEARDEASRRHAEQQGRDGVEASALQPSM
jgi:hypothetical protein